MRVIDAEFPRIVSDPGIFSGVPIIRGLRYSVANALEDLAGGVSVAEILAEFPFLEAEDVKEALLFAAKYLAEIDLCRAILPGQD